MQQLETTLLAAIIQRGGDDILAKLTEDDFYNINNKKILVTLRNMWMRSKTISYATVKAEEPGIAIGDILAAGELTTSTKAEIDELAKTVKNHAALQKINRLAADIKKNIQTEKDAKTVKTQIYEALNDIDTDIREAKVKDLQSVLLETTEWIDRQYLKAQNDDMMLTGIADLDYYTGGLFDSEMTVIAARPSVGKTALGMFIALKLSQEGRKVHFVSREMSHTGLGTRILSMSSGVDTWKIKAGKISDDEWAKMSRGAGKYSNKNLIIDTTSQTPSDIKAMARELQARDALDLIVIDYLQILAPDGKHSNREQEVASISRSIKSLSLDIDKPIIILAQLNRNAQNKRPTLADLRESGAIEADADNVWFLHYPSENQIDGDKKDRFMACKNNGYRYTEIIIGKHRNGPVGMMDVLFDPGRMRFISFTKGETS